MVTTFPLLCFALLCSALLFSNSFLSFSGSDSAPHPTQSKCRGGDASSNNSNHKPAAGVFTQPFATQYILLALEGAIDRGIITEKDVTQDRLEQFLGGVGRRFYKIPSTSSSSDDGDGGNSFSAKATSNDDSQTNHSGNGSRSGSGSERIMLERKGERIPERVRNEDGSIEVGLIRGGDEIFSLRWVSSSTSA